MIRKISILLTLWLLMLVSVSYAAVEIKQSTNTHINCGPFVDDADGVTRITTMTLSGVDCFLSDGSNTQTLPLSSTPGAGNELTHIGDGMYTLDMTVENLTTMGHHTISFRDDNIFAPRREDIEVVSANYYDWKYGATNVNANTLQIEGVDATDQLDAHGGSGGTTPSEIFTHFMSATSGSIQVDASGYMKVSDGTGIGQIDTDVGTVLLRSATETQIDNIETDTGTTIISMLDDQSTTLNLVLEDTNELQTNQGNWITADITAMSDSVTEILIDTEFTLFQKVSDTYNMSVLILADTLALTTTAELRALLTDSDTPVATATNQTTITTMLTDQDTSNNLILADTDELQTNQGNWLTATGFATSGALATHDGKLDVVDDYVDTEIASIKAVTDDFSFTGSDVIATLDSELVDLNADQSTVTVGVVTSITNNVNANSMTEVLNLVTMIKSESISQNDPFTFTGADVHATLDSETVTVSSNLDKTEYSIAGTSTTLDAITGNAFDRSTDGLEAIRNRGDSAWITGAGGSSPTTNEITDAVWDELVSGHVIASSFGDKLQNKVPSATLNDYKADVTNLDVAVSTRSSHTANNVRDAILSDSTPFAGANITSIKVVTDNFAFSGSDVKATLDSETVNLLPATQTQIDNIVSISSSNQGMLITTDNMTENVGTYDRFTNYALERAPTGGGGGGDATAANQTTIITNQTAMSTSVNNIEVRLDDMTEDDGGTFRYTTNALEQAPNETGGGTASEANQTTIISMLTDQDTTINQIDGATTKLDSMLENPGTYERYTNYALERAPAGGVGGGDATAANQTTMINKLNWIKDQNDTNNTVSDSIKVITDNFAFSGSDVKATLDSELVDLNADQSTVTVGTVTSITNNVNANSVTDVLAKVTMIQAETVTIGEDAIDTKFTFTGADVHATLDGETVALSVATENQIDAIETDTDEIQGKLPSGTISDFTPAQAVTVGTSLDKTGYSLASDQSSVTIGTVNAMGTQAKADVNAEADTALTDYDPPTRAELTTDKNSIITEVDANENKIDTMDLVVDDIKAETTTITNDVKDMSSTVNISKKMLFNRFLIDDVSVKIVIYEDDGVNTFQIFTILDNIGSPSSTNIFERKPD